MGENFTSIEKLMESGTKKIVLTSDMELDRQININVDGLVIDGGYHRVAANLKSRIFRINANNVTIKNLRFKHGFADCGAAILNEGSVNLIHCTFLFNEASACGGAILNRGSIEMSKCRLASNSSKSKGGAIANFGSVILKGCLFSDNSSEDAGALLNEGTVDIDGGGFNRNLARSCGGAIVNKKDMTIKNASFRGNVGYEMASAIYNLDKLTIHDSLVKDINSKNPIINDENAFFELKDTIFED